MRSLLMTFGQKASHLQVVSRMPLLAASAAAGFAVGATASAQDVQSSDAVARGNLTEVVVTARRSEERLVDTPLSITAFSESTLSTFNIQSFTDVLNRVPGLAFSEGGGGSGNNSGFTGSRGITIRGMVGQNMTGVYLDDVAIPPQQSPHLIDLARVEVLKGPQGTLFGSGSMGGTIRYISNQPNLVDNEVKYMVRLGNTKGADSPDYGMEFIGNAVVVPDKFAVRLAAYSDKKAGFITKTFPSAYGSSTLDHVDGLGANEQVGATLTSLYRASDSLDITAKVIAQWENYPKSWPVLYRGLTQFDPTSLQLSRATNSDEFTSNRWAIPSLTLSYKKDAFRIVSSTSYFVRNTTDMEDITEAMQQVISQRYNIISIDPHRSTMDRTEKSFQHESRLAFDTAFNLSGTVGVYYEHFDELRNTRPRTVKELLTENRWPTDLYFKSTTDRVSKNTAVFGEFDYEVLDRLTLTAGVRRYWLKTTQLQSFSSGFVVNRLTANPFPVNVDQSGYSPKYSIRFAPNDNMSVYGSAARGFRPGGYRGPALNLGPICLAERLSVGIPSEEGIIDSDSVWTYELGAKANASGMFLSGALYQTDWSDIQQTVTLTSCGSSMTANTGAARIRGAEFEIVGGVTPNLQVRAGLGYTEAKIVDDEGGRTVQKLGDTVFGVPKLTATAGIAYTHQFANAMEGFLVTDVNYTGSTLSPNSSTANPGKRGAYSLWNARFGARFGEQNQNELSLYVDNILDTLANYGDLNSPQFETRVINGVNTPYSRVVVSRPRQIGLQFRRGF